MTSEQRYDVAILGGGLAGLTLAIQLKRTRPQTSVLVVEKTAHPVPESAHKVGESSVEVASHYFSNVLGLKEHLESQQLPKFGLRFFFPFRDNSDISQRLEIGPGDWAQVPSYQIDRGRFENFLGEEAQRLGAEFHSSCKVESVSLSPQGHLVSYQHGGATRSARARWIVDATGRSSLLKRQLGLEKSNDHNACAAWFRIGDRIAVDDWADTPEWRARQSHGKRWYSTVHLMGNGYWVWLIPLASGSTSIGIVADPALHPFDQINTFERAMAWLREHEPQCAQKVDAKRNLLQDFRVLKHYSHGSALVFSPEHWCLTGEAGVFLDPFYSPGSDLIAWSNTDITDMVSRDLDGQMVMPNIMANNGIYNGHYEGLLTVYRGQYPIFGNSQVMTAKTVFDFAFYWGFPALLFFQGKWCDLALRGTVAPQMQQAGRLNVRVQQFFREWNALEQREWSNYFMGHYEDIPFLLELHKQLAVPLDENALRGRIAQNLELCEALAAEMFRKAATLVSPVIPDTQPVNAYAISMNPDSWQADGVFAETGRPRNPKIAADMESIWFDVRGASLAPAAS